MFRFAICSLALLLAATDAEAGRRQLLGGGSHGGPPANYAVPLDVYAAPPQPVYVAPPAPVMQERWVQGPSRVERRQVEVDVQVPGEWYKETVPCQPAAPLMLSTPACDAQLTLLTPECRRRADRKAKRAEKRLQRRSSSLGIEEPEELPAPLEEPQPTPVDE